MDYQHEIARFVWVWWKEHLDTELETDKAVQIAGEGITALTYSANDKDAISLWDRSPYSLFAEADNSVVIDHSAMLTLISGLFREVAFLDGEFGNIKADAFEDAVCDAIESAGFDTWKRGKLTSPDGTTRDLDASFVSNGTLYVIECKAFSQQGRLDRADYAALKGRRETLEKYLDQADTLASLITAHPKGRNYEVPAEVEKIEPCVCTSGVEYIWSTAAPLWLTKTVPRIATIDELMAAAHSGT